MPKRRRKNRQRKPPPREEAPSPPPAPESAPVPEAKAEAAPQPPPTEPAAPETAAPEGPAAAPEMLLPQAAAAPAREFVSLKIGITGASGFIGRLTARLAAERGHQVVGFSRSPGQHLPATVETREFTRPEEADYRGLDVVIHLAGEPVAGLWTEEKKRRIRESRVEGTRALVRGLERLRAAERPRALVCASATGYYGDAGDELVDEDSDGGFGFLAGVVKGWEGAAREAAEIGLRVAMPRIGFVLGEGGGALPLLRRVFLLCLGGRLGTGDQWMPWVHVSDVARVLLECAEDQALAGPVNAVAPRAVTNRAFTAALAKLLERPAALPAPAFALKRLPGGMAELLLFSQRVDPAALRLRGFLWEHSDLEPALRDALGLGTPNSGADSPAMLD